MLLSHYRITTSTNTDKIQIQNQGPELASAASPFSCFHCFRAFLLSGVSHTTYYLFTRFLCCSGRTASSLFFCFCLLLAAPLLALAVLCFFSLSFFFVLRSLLPTSVIRSAYSPLRLPSGLSGLTSSSVSTWFCCPLHSSCT